MYSYKSCFWKHFLFFTKHNGMLQAKQITNVLFSLPFIAQYAHRFCIVLAMSSMIINRFRLVLSLRWTRHWYFLFSALMVSN